MMRVSAHFAFFSVFLFVRLLGGCVFSDDYRRFSVGEPDGGGGRTDSGEQDGSVSCDRDDAVFVAVSGDDDGPGTREQPLASIPAALLRVAESATLTRVYVSAGTFDTTYESDDQIILVDGVTLRGGFSDDFCDYDPQAHVTLVRQRFGHGIDDDFDPSEPPIVAIQGDDLPSGVTLEGFRVDVGVEPDDPHTGILLRNTSAVIRDVSLSGGDGRSLKGLSIEGGGSATLERVAVALENASHELTAVSLRDVAAAVIRELDVRRPQETSEMNSIGFSADYVAPGGAPTLVIERSRVHGGRGGPSSTGIRINDERGPGNTPVTTRIVNNQVHSGDAGGQHRGVWITGASRNTSIFHNTIHASGQGVPSYAIQYEYSSAGADIRNNVIIMGRDSLGQQPTPHFCIYRFGDDPWDGSNETLSNNVFVDCTFALLSNGSELVTDVAALNALVSVEANHATSTLPLVSLAGPDGVVGTMDNNDWSLAAEAPCAYSRGAFPLANVSEDYLGAPRGATPSIGAFERVGPCAAP